MDKELSPMEYERMVATGKVRPQTTNYLKPALLIIGVMLLCVASFMGGVSYQKSRAPAATTATNGVFGGGPQSTFGNRQPPNVGKVTAIASDSIIIDNGQTGASQTYKITSDTTVDNNGSTGAVSDIKTGDTVFIETSSSDAMTANRIILNPPMVQSSAL